MPQTDMDAPLAACLAQPAWPLVDWDGTDQGRNPQRPLFSGDGPFGWHERLDVICTDQHSYVPIIKLTFLIEGWTQALWLRRGTLVWPTGSEESHQLGNDDKSCDTHDYSTAN